MNEDLIGQISDEEIRQRVNTLKRLIEKEQADILKEVSAEIENFISKKLYGQESKQDEVYDAFKMFYKACENLMAVYFPLVQDENFLLLQSQHEIMSKIVQLKSSIKKNLKILFDKSKMSKSEWEKQFQRRLKQEKLPKRGRNSKTPIESTQVLIRWLLKNFKNPYPTNQEKQILAGESNLSMSQVSNWFINARERVIKKYLKKDIRDGGQRKKNSDASEQLN